MIKQIHIFSIILMLCTPAAMAGTIIHIQNGNEISTLLTDGRQARMNLGGSDYIIVDYRDQSVKAVNPQKGQVMLLNADDIPNGNKVSKIETSVRHLGAGPVIAGYKTQKFAYSAKGKSCGVIYGSQQAFKVKGIEDLINAMKIMAEKQQAMMGGFAGMMDDCLRAGIEMSEHVKTIGVPMRTEDNGVVDSEVKSIQPNVNLPANTFVVPASYQTVSVKGEVQKASKDVAAMQQKIQQYQPQIQQMMQQMQQSGQMSPQAMEQMRRVQGVMQQYQ